MGVNDYTGNSNPGKAEGGGKEYRTVYNDSGSAISNGAIKLLVEKVVSGVGLVLVPIAAATNATTSNVIGICENAGGSIANGAYGQFLVKGLYGSVSGGYGVTCAAGVADNDQLEVINAGTTFLDAGTDGGTVILDETCALAVDEVVDASDTWVVYLHGRQCTIAGS